MELSQQGEQGEGSPLKKVSFAQDGDLSESARLLERHALSSFPPPGPSNHSSGGSPFVSPSFVATPPPAQTISMSNPMLQTPPDNIDDWPNAPMRIACTHCGHYVETTMSEETEYMGYRSCFTGRPVFRRSFVHYCPNCGESIGFHYTGEDCFCNHKRSTMTCDAVMSAFCAVPGCCD